MNPNDPRWKQLIQEFSNDPEFLSFSEPDQDWILDTAFQKKYGDIPNSENLLQRAINFSVAGLPSAVSPAENRPEDALPMITQFGTDMAMKSTPQGRMASLIPGIPMAATTLATTGAEGIRQGTKALRGEGFNIGEIGKTAAITAGTEAVGRTAENALFRTEIGKSAIKGAKKHLGNALNRLFEVARTNPTISIMKDDLLGMLDSAYQNIPFKIGPQSSGLRKVVSTIRNEFPDIIGPQEISATENMLGDIASFDPTKAGSMKNKMANIAVKEGRTQTSGLLEDMAQEAGVPEVKTASREAHLTQKKYASKKQGLAEVVSNRVTRPGVIGGVVGKASGNPLMGFGAAGADLLFQSEPIKNFLYNLIVKSGISRGSRVGISEVIRKNS